MNTFPSHCHVPTKLAEAVLRSGGVELENIMTDLPLLQTITGKYRYPLRDMDIGQHFYVPCNGRSVVKLQNAVSSSIGNVQRSSTRKFHQRRYKRGIRVWRTA